MVLDDRFYPIDTKIGFIKGDLDMLSGFIVSWDHRVYEPLGISTARTEIDGTLAHCFEKLLPLTSIQIRRHLLIPCSNGWIAFFNNSYRGTDTSAVGYIAKSLRTYAVAVTVVPEFDGRSGGKVSPHAGTIDFTLYGPDKTAYLNMIRSISVENLDGQWSFKTEGIPQSFERESNYEKVKIRDRFNLRIMNDYLSSLGIRAFEESFYDTSRAILLERSGRFNPLMKEYSIEEALGN